MDHQIGLYILGILSLLGGIEMVRFSWADSRQERQHDMFGTTFDNASVDMQPGHLGVTVGFALVVLGFVAFYGGYSGWTIMKILTTVKDIAI